jgi:XTP/dITP diphosphohydrolase
VTTGGVVALLATRSQGKLRELRPLFGARGIALVDLDEAGVSERPEEEALEVFESFEENAVAKARYFHALTGRPTFADDSGIAVDALDGAPGVRSKRWSGRTDLSGQALDDENNRLLLARLRGVENRRAQYVCAAAFVDRARVFVERGTVVGHIVDKARGTYGFGYDPFFVSDELGRTFGEATRAEKEVVSHRGRAFRALLARWVADGAAP